MKRLLVTGPRTVEFDETPDPECPRDGVVIDARLTAISTGTEIRVYRGIPVDSAGQFLHERVPFRLPVENGYSMVGEIVEAGSDVTSLRVGDRVFGRGPHGQRAALPATDVTRIPEHVSDEDAVFLNILEVGHIALRRGRPAPGENVAAVGQGVIGLGVTGYCRAFGFRSAAIDLSPARLQIARQMGAGLAVSPEEAGYRDRVLEHFDGQGADLVVEAASRWNAVQSAMDVAAQEARIVVAARHTGIPQFNPVGHPYLGKRLTLLTSYGHEPPGGRWDRTRSVALTLRLLSEGRLSAVPMITHRVRWDQLPEMYRRLDAGDPEIVGVTVRWK